MTNYRAPDTLPSITGWRLNQTVMPPLRSFFLWGFAGRIKSESWIKIMDLDHWDQRNLRTMRTWHDENHCENTLITMKNWTPHFLNLKFLTFAILSHNSTHFQCIFIWQWRCCELTNNWPWYGYTIGELVKQKMSESQTICLLTFKWIPWDELIRPKVICR